MKIDRDMRPRLRRVEAFPVDANGGRAIAIRDPSGYTDAVMLLPVPLLDIVSMFDGDHSIGDIQAAIMRRHGELVGTDRLGAIVETLDENGFLDSSRFAERRKSIEEAFLTRAVRPATHAGGAYAGDPDTLRAQMNGFFDEPHGPGPIDWIRGEARTRPGPAGSIVGGLGHDGVPSAPGSGGPAPTPRAAPVRGLVAPHIDFHRGGPAYAWGYRDLAERSDADCFVILGTSHAGLANPFALTMKAYETPLGPAPVDRDFVEALAHRSGQDLFGSELGHRSEHSIEFQAVFLRYLFAGRRDLTIVPVLASFVHEAIAQGHGPEDDPRVPRFLDALAETIADSSRRVAVIAGADLAHVGPRFGDPDPVTPDWLASIEVDDRAMLGAVETGDAGAFFESAARDGDRRRICGLSPIYALLRVLGQPRGAVRHYGQWPDPHGAVTFASVVMT
jgi:AmmeMemoRadiSam system protein B